MFDIFALFLVENNGYLFSGFLCLGEMGFERGKQTKQRKGVSRDGQRV